MLSLRANAACRAAFTSVRCLATASNRNTIKTAPGKPEATEGAKSAVPSPPTRPPNAYALYIKSMAGQRDDQMPTQFLSSLAASWREMSSYDKMRFQQQAQEFKNQYEKDMKKWEQQHDRDVYKHQQLEKQLSVSLVKKNRLLKQKKKAENPKKPLNAYIHFCAQLRKELPNEAVSAAIAFSEMASKKWKSLSDAQKKPFVQLYEQDKARYDREVSASSQ